MGHIGKGIVMGAAVISATWLQVSGHGSQLMWWALIFWVGVSEWNPYKD